MTRFYQYSGVPKAVTGGLLLAGFLLDLQEGRSGAFVWVLLGVSLLLLLWGIRTWKQLRLEVGNGEIVVHGKRGEVSLPMEEITLVTRRWYSLSLKVVTQSGDVVLVGGAEWFREEDLRAAFPEQYGKGRV